MALFADFLHISFLKAEGESDISVDSFPEICYTNYGRAVTRCGNWELYLMDQEKVLTTAKEYAAAVRKVVDATAVFLYGSYAKGTATKDSDIDIAVVAGRIPGDYLDTMAALWRLTRQVNQEIEPVLLTSADDENGFLSSVQRTGIAV